MFTAYQNASLDYYSAVVNSSRKHDPFLGGFLSLKLNKLRVSLLYASVLSEIMFQYLQLTQYAVIESYCDIFN